MEGSYPLITKDWSFLLPSWAPYGRIGVKLNRLLQSTPELANTLWAKNLLKIAHNKNWPHCNTCQCARPDESSLTELLLDEEDIIKLRVVNLQCDSSVNRALVSIYQPVLNPPCPILPAVLVPSNWSASAVGDEIPRVVTYRQEPAAAEPPAVLRRETAVARTPSADRSEVGPSTGGVM